MSSPRRYEQSLGSGYKLEVDVIRDDCRREPAHWHLCKNGRRVGQIWVDSCRFESTPSDVPRSIINEALRVTSRNSSEIKAAYKYNSENGSTW